MPETMPQTITVTLNLNLSVCGVSLPRAFVERLLLHINLSQLADAIGRPPGQKLNDWATSPDREQ